MDEPHPADLLNRTIAADPARPLITFYDDAGGERIELSAKTFGNWVAKTANLLVDGLDAQPGERVALLLPPHWQTAVWAFAVWSAGLTVQVGGAEGADIVAVAESGLTADHPDAREIVGLSLHAFGMPLAERPGYMVDYAAEVRSYGDRFAAPPLDPQAPALHVEPGPHSSPYSGTSHHSEGKGVMSITLSGQDVVTRGHEAAARWRLDARSRLLVAMDLATVSGLITGLIAPMSTAASVIICRNLDKAVLDQRVSVEHVTAVAGTGDWGDLPASVDRLT